MTNPDTIMDEHINVIRLTIGYDNDQKYTVRGDLYGPAAAKYRNVFYSTQGSDILQSTLAVSKVLGWYEQGVLFSTANMPQIFAQDGKPRLVCVYDDYSNLWRARIIGPGKPVSANRRTTLRGLFEDVIAPYAEGLATAPTAIAGFHESNIELLPTATDVPDTRNRVKISICLDKSRLWLATFGGNKKTTNHVYSGAKWAGYSPQDALQSLLRTVFGWEIHEPSIPGDDLSLLRKYIDGTSLQLTVHPVTRIMKLSTAYTDGAGSTQQRSYYKTSRSFFDLAYATILPELRALEHKQHTIQ